MLHMEVCAVVAVRVVLQLVRSISWKRVCKEMFNLGSMMGQHGFEKIVIKK